jgi:WD40 repeat protein
MSLLERDTKFPDFTLRRHTHGVTSLCLIRVPLTVQKKLITSSSSTPMILKPYLLSGDQEGLLILWDMSTRRSIYSWQGHQGHILVIKQMGIDQKSGSIDDKFFGLVYSHGRDNCVKFWRLFNLAGKFRCDHIYDLPENALNFSNVDHWGHVMVTPNTMESGKFDIYDIGFLGESDISENKLKRLYEAVNVYQRAIDEGYEFNEFKLQRDEDEMSRVDKFGIIMRLLLVRKDLLVIGYESGHVAILKLNYDDKSYEILSITSEHFPNPVLSLFYDSHNYVVASTSIASHIAFHDLNTYKSTVMKLYKFGKICTMGSINDKYVLSSWNGTTKFYILSDNNLDYQASFTKPKGMISGDLNIIGNLQDDQLKRQSVIKPNVITICDSHSVSPNIMKLIGRRDLKVIESKILTIGYDDGTIAVYMNF